MNENPMVREVIATADCIPLAVGIFSALTLDALRAYERLSLRDGHTEQEALETQFYRTRYLILRNLREQFENEMAKEVP